MAMRLAVLASLAATGLALAPAAWGRGAQNTTVPVSLVTWSRCPPAADAEQIEFEGFMHVTYSFTANAAGGFREHFHANVHLEGVGLVTGDRYVSSNTSSLGGTYPSNGRSLVVEISHLQEVHTGETTEEDDFSLRMVLSPGGVSFEREGCQ